MKINRQLIRMDSLMVAANIKKMSRLDGFSAYLLLLRVIFEQTEKDPDGTYRLKGAGSGMTADILQNPADPEATFREKAGKQYRGYAANIHRRSRNGGQPCHRLPVY